jgi:hypothetical protein
VDIVMTPGWQEEIFTATDELFLTILGPEIWADAVRYCPVFGGDNSTASEASLASVSEDYEPGALRDSIEFHLNGHTLIVSATGSDERSYAYYVEMGHRIVAFGYDTGEHKEAQPFLRPALYQTRAMS